MKSCNSFPQLKLHKGITSQVPYIAYPWCPLMSTDVSFNGSFTEFRSKKELCKRWRLGRWMSLDVVVANDVKCPATSKGWPSR